MKANLFDVLNTMNTEHEGSLHAYFSDNIQQVNAGKGGWGSIKMAIITADAQEVLSGAVRGEVTKSVMLFVVDRGVMEKVRDAIQEKLDEKDRMMRNTGNA